MLGIYIAGKLVPYYGIMIVLGGMAATGLAFLLVRRFRLSTDSLMILEAYAVGGCFLGAKGLSLFQLMHLIEWSRMLQKEYFQMVMQSGYVFYGGLIGGIGLAYLGGRLHKIQTSDYLKTVVPCLPLAHGVGRIGCHLAGCCYGIPYNGFGHVIYHVPSFAPTGIPLFPVQLFEASLNFLLSAILLIKEWRNGPSGRMVYFYLWAYAIIRLFEEKYLRYDLLERGKYGPFTTSEWISMGILVITAIVWGCGKYHDRKKKEA